ncbi:hypothetical protein HUO13_11175 [Saccharopolyspora erythraea]|uniref:hypothetical protein n=1 Tax=Saccharopolyspora erythraea TaxID=1836 RepID=UPI001BA7D0C5|nr:hypothetical protein [Saccharopolyspora erythraea]QUH01289.1 hypothetical protein HUO13_11175 [Saccharopolyspora erythraea]
MLRVRPTSVVLATFVEHHRRASRFLRPLLVPVHHLILRYLLARAAKARGGHCGRMPIAVG